MDNTREKLIELLRAVQYQGNAVHGHHDRYIQNGELADHLIANGVTVQKEAKLYWKPVKPGEWNLTCSACDSHLGCREGAKHCPECGAKFVYPKAVMPNRRKENDMNHDATHCADYKKGNTMNDLISRKALIAEYDRVHIGPPGGARKLMEDAPAVQQWIPVTERLPQEWTDVLVWSKCGFCVVAVSLGSHGKWRESWTHMMIDDDTVTHWMPLPEPPKDDKLDKLAETGIKLGLLEEVE